jgi:hypothetical protein
MGAMLLVVGVAALWSPRVDADSASVRRAKQLFRQADSAYQLGAYNQALEKFEAALKLARRPSILLNIAQCHRQLGNANKALHFYQQYLSEWELVSPGVEVPYKREVEGHIAHLKAELGQDERAVVVGPGAGSGKNLTTPERQAQPGEAARLRLEGVPAGAEVMIDGELVQRARGGPVRLRLEPGEYALLVSLPGHEPWQREVMVEAGDDVRYLVAMTKAKSSGSTAWLVTGICTATLAVGAEIFAIISTVLANDSVRGSKKFDGYQAMAITGHVLAGTFLITSGISWWLYYRSTRPRPNEARAALGVAPRGDGFTAAVRVRF